MIGKRFRSAITGRFVRERAADSAPTRTVGEYRSLMARRVAVDVAENVSFGLREPERAGQALRNIGDKVALSTDDPQVRDILTRAGWPEWWETWEPPSK